MIGDPTSLRLFSPSGVVAQRAVLRRAARRLGTLGFDVSIDESALARDERFAGDDETRVAAIHRAAASGASIAMATRGGYGLTRLLDRIDWKRVARSADRGMRWVGHSDFTAFQMAALAHGGTRTWAGPMACYDFGRLAEEHGEPRVEAVDDVTAACFIEAMDGSLEAVGFRTDPGFDGLDVRGALWGGNLAMLVSLLGTPHWPNVKRGILFLEDVNEHPYRVERMLLQLHQAGVLDAQRAVVLGRVTDWQRSPLDRGYDMASMLCSVRAATKTPVLTGLPFGHVPTKVTLPVGARVTLATQGREAYIGWA
ncbi:MAG: LD-carboxypeptidase [Aquincola sp.]|nr:LD-carboxypeptidase [Aquincola sp.]MDH4288204.1 LD-carboxypeptidase [Aquincola sp.]MDH5328981.1 LD-carboxypeptidase [Aquincola sp.]